MMPHRRRKTLGFGYSGMGWIYSEEFWSFLFQYLSNLKHVYYKSEWFNLRSSVNKGPALYVSNDTANTAAKRKEDLFSKFTGVCEVENCAPGPTYSEQHAKP